MLFGCTVVVVVDTDTGASELITVVRGNVVFVSGRVEVVVVWNSNDLPVTDAVPVA